MLFRFLASAHLHDRVAFLLPGIPLTLKALRPKRFPENPRSLGQHLLRRRLQLGDLQYQVAPRLGVSTDTYLFWEKDRTEPEARYYPRIFAFLGYNPLPPPTTLGDQLKRKRLELGLTLRAAALLIGADEGSLARWETGEWKPRMSMAKVNAFLAIQLAIGTPSTHSPISDAATHRADRQRMTLVV